MSTVTLEIGECQSLLQREMSVNCHVKDTCSNYHVKSNSVSIVRSREGESQLSVEREIIVIHYLKDNCHFEEKISLRYSVTFKCKLSPLGEVNVIYD